MRLERAPGIGVVAAGDFDRRLDQETAGVIADRAERIVVELEPPARRLANDRAGHRRRQRRLVGALGRRHRQAQLSGGVELWRRWWRRAGTRRPFWPELAGIELWRLALAVERVVAGTPWRRSRQADHRSESGRIPRWRRRIAAALPVAGIAFRVTGIVGALA